VEEEEEVGGGGGPSAAIPQFGNPENRKNQHSVPKHRK
jgi:hypothetical protein